MAKKDNEIPGFLIVLGIVASPFIWLHETVGAVWFWVIIGFVLICVLVWLFSDSSPQKSTATQKTAFKSTQPHKSPKSRAVHTVIKLDTTTGQEVVVIDWPAQFAEIEQAITEKDYDFARTWLQKFAYNITGNNDVPQSVKDRFKQVMTRFASEDPLYRDVMDRLLPMVQANPGMIQSQVYKDQPDEIKEQMRYVLYFADELGHIERVKKGNSYRLYLPALQDGKVIDAV